MDRIGGVRASFRLTACAVCAGTAVGQPTFTNLGVPGGADATLARAVSADGSVVVGSAHLSAAGTWHAFRWSAATGMVDLGTLPIGASSDAYGVSGDGSVVVGTAALLSGAQRGFKWSAAGGMQDLGTVAGTSSSAYGANADGAVIVGGSNTASGDYHAVRWTGSSIQDIGALPGGRDARAYGVSADGSVIVGYSSTSQGYREFRWTSAAGMQDLGAFFAGMVSADGLVAAGYSMGSLGFPRAIRWTQGTGIQDLGAIPPWPYSRSYGVNGDGSIVVGSAQERAFLWGAGRGIVDLNGYLPMLGVDLTGWTLTYGMAVSGDGTAISGYGLIGGSTRAWLVRGLSVGCYANCDASTGSPCLTALDFACFLDKFAAGDTYANCDASATPPRLNVNDFMCFLNRFIAGCPNC